MNLVFLVILEEKKGQNYVYQDQIRIFLTQHILNVLYSWLEMHLDHYACFYSHF